MINVGVKTDEPETSIDSSESDTNWGDVLADSVAQATAILSLVLLLQRID